MRGENKIMIEENIEGEMNKGVKGGEGRSGKGELDNIGETDVRGGR